jgi:hypothetical protein
VTSWVKLKALQKRMHMIDHGIYYGDLVKIGWDHLDAALQKDLSMVGSWNVGKLVYESLLDKLESETSDNRLYEADAKKEEEKLVKSGTGTRTWEVKHRSHTADLMELYTEVEWLGSHLGATGARPTSEGTVGPVDLSSSGVQIHMAFKRPTQCKDDKAAESSTVRQECRRWGRRISALAGLLDDRDMLRGIAANPINITNPFLGAVSAEFLEKQGEEIGGASLRGYSESKVNWVSLRHGPYDKSSGSELLGFEFRTTDDPRLRETIRLIAKTFSTWESWKEENDPKALRIDPTRRRADGKNSSYTIASLVSVEHTSEAVCKRMNPEMLSFLDSKVAGHLFWKGRWCVPYVKWEDHPAIQALGLSPKIKVELDEARQKFEKAVAAAMKADANQGRTMGLQALTNWAKSTKLWEYF